MDNTNSMGSQVVEGFKCKPKDFEKDKPVMFSAIQVFVCSGERCREGRPDTLADKVREIISSMGLDKGENRVKVTRTFCNGACRFRNYAYVYKNIHAANFTPKTAYSAWKQVETWTDDQWQELILSIKDGKEPHALSDFRVESQVYDEYHRHKK